MGKYLNIVLFILGCYVAYLIRDVVFVFYVALLLALATNPLVDWLEKWRIPRGLSIVLMYVFFWSLFGLIIALISPPLVLQTKHLIAVLPESIKNIELIANYQDEISKELLSRISSLPQAVLSITIGFFSNLLTVFTTLVITYYLLIQHKNLPEMLSAIPLPKLKKSPLQIMAKVEERLVSWMFGELALMFLVGVMTFAGLKLLGVDAALPLATIAGILELIPNIGPTISAIPAILVALTVHPLLALSTTALYFLVQFLENNFLVPKIMQKAAGVNPIVSILGLLAGFKLAGPLGAVLAIPTIITIETIWKEIG